MTETQKLFVELERKKEEIKKYFDELQSTLGNLVKEQGLDSYFMDDQGIVYKVEECTGRFVHFDKYGYSRTRRNGERAGTLSMKEAAEHGFKVD